MESKVQYDDAADVLHVSFGTGEPAYVRSLDDFFLLEIGVYSHLPTGFQLVHPKKKGVKEFTLAMREFKRREPMMEKEYRQSLKGRERIIQEAFRRAEWVLEKADV